MWKWSVVFIVIIVFFSGGITYKSDLLTFYSKLSMPEMNSDGHTETAMEHAEKHLDPNYICPMHGQIIQNEPGSCPICGMDLVLQEVEQPEKMSREEKILYWVAPMDANYRRDKPGKSPMGMDLVPVYDQPEQSSDAVHISAAVQQNIGVKTVKVLRGELQPKVSTVGYVEYDEDAISHIHIRTEGWVEKLIIRAVGERVKNGQLIAEIYSPEIIRAQQDFIQVLAQDGSSLSRAAERNLMALGMSRTQLQRLRKTRKVTQTLKIYAPQDGIVERMMVRDGMFVTPKDELFSLVKLSSVWIQASVFERQAKSIAEGQAMTAILNAFPQRQWSGKVDYIYPELDEMTRTLRVRLRVPNDDRKLKKGMYAEVNINVDKINNVLIIPRQAVIRDAQQERVIVALGEGRFQAREVITGAEVNEQVAVLSGLKEGEEIVTSAQFLIDSEASLKASFARMQETK